MKSLACLLLIGVIINSCNQSAHKPEFEAKTETGNAEKIELQLRELGALRNRLARLQETHANSTFEDSITDLEFRGNAALRTKLSAGNEMESLEHLLGEYRYREAQFLDMLRDEQLYVQQAASTAERWKKELRAAQRDIDRLVDHLYLLEKEICDREAEIAALEDSLNKVYFAFGSASELEENGVVSTQKSLWGKQRSAVLRPDFNKDYFSVADRRSLQEIPILSDKAALLSHHPADSFRWREDNGVEAIEILDPQRFWEHSTYLAVWVE